MDAGQPPEFILVVDDEELIRSFVQAILRRAGYTVLAADGAAAGMRLFERHPLAIALLLTDVRMPGMSGLELAGHLRRVQPHLPVLLMSGVSSTETSGFDVVRKPFTPHELLRRTAGILDSRRPLGVRIVETLQT
jgi:two-component system, cell cycle sensor histidine kinase and response regulator CckA